MRTHDERVLVASLGSLNADLSRYVLTVIQADHEGLEAWPHSAEDEAALALRLVQLAGRLNIHAKLLLDEKPEAATKVVEGTVDKARPVDSATP